MASLQPESHDFAADAPSPEAWRKAFDASNCKITWIDNLQYNEVNSRQEILDGFAWRGMPGPPSDFDQTHKIGSDLILDKVLNKNKQPEVDDASELARTAGELLESMKYERSQKFEKSNFLSLMRQLRDREVQVEGDEIVEVSILLLYTSSKEYNTLLLHLRRTA